MAEISDKLRYIIEAYEIYWMSTVGTSNNEVKSIVCEDVMSTQSKEKNPKY